MRLAGVLATLLLATPALASTANAVSVEMLARVSDAVARGRVSSVTARWSDDRRRISSTIRLDVTSVWRGKVGRAIEVVVPGGVVGHIEQHVDGAPRFARGEDVVVFLDRRGPDSYTVEGLAQGKFSVQGATAAPDLSHLHFASVQVRVGERRAETMRLAELERRVRSVP